MRVTAKITSKGQVTIPRQLRRKLGIKPGDRLVFENHDQEEILLTKLSLPTSLLRGFLKDKISRKDLPVSIDEMEEAIRKGAARGRF